MPEIEDRVKVLEELLVDNVEFFNVRFEQAKGERARLSADISGIRSELGIVKADIRHLKLDVTGVKSSVEEMNQKLDTIAEMIQSLKDG